MLHQRDYILRLIEQLGQMLIQARNRILGMESGTLDQLEAQLGEWARASGMDLDLVRRLTPDSLGLLIAPTGTVEPGRCWVWAEILYLDGLLAERRIQTEQARQSLESALALYHLVEPGWKPAEQAPAAEERIREIEEQLAALGNAGEG